MTETSKFTENDWVTFTTWIKEILKEQVVTVTFLKKDGSERVMKCTLNSTHLPETPLVEDKKVKKANENVLSVFDVENNGWRSFTVRSVKNVRFTIG